MKVLLRCGRWTLAYWPDGWTWLPLRNTYWSGGLVYYSWLMLELIHDRRGNMLADWIAGRRTDVP